MEMGDPCRDEIGDVLVEQVVRPESNNQQGDTLGQLESADEPQRRIARGASLAYQSSVSPGFGSQTARGSSFRRSTSAAIRRGGSSYGSRASSKVPQ